MNLRPYQHRAVAAIREALGRHRSIVFVLPTGGGKTAVACEMIRLALARQRRCLFLAHRIELVEQARDRLATFGIEAGIIKAGFVPSPAAPVQVASVPTLIRREFPPASLVIVDECHHGVSESFARVIQHYREAGAWICGLTATASRLDGRPLKEQFDEIVQPVTTMELIDAGFLVEPIVFAPPSISRAGLHKQGGDYALPELAERMEKLTGSITEYWSRYCRDRRTLAFAVNVAHSRLIEDALRDCGARVAHVDGTTPCDERASANARLQDGTLDVVTQCSVWSEGFDAPSLSALIVARPTASLSLHRQMIGRVMRTAPGKTDALVLDHAGNSHVHGSVTDPVEWSLDGRPRKAPAAPTRTCSNCFAIVAPGVDPCPACGEPMGQAADADPPAVENPGELVRFVPMAKADIALWYGDRVREAGQRGYTVGWARFRYKDRFGVWPRLRAVEREAYPPCVRHQYTLKEYGPKRVERCERCYDERAVTRAAGLT